MRTRLTVKKGLNTSTSKPKPIGGVIENVVQSLGLSNGYNGWMVVTRWPEIVGDYISRYAHAFRYHEGVLYVEVKDSSQRQNLAMQIDEILRTIRSYPFGRAIRQVRLVGTQRG